MPESRLLGSRAPFGVALATALLLMPAAAAAQATVEGIVFDSLRGAPLAGAVVRIDTARTVTSDARGRFRADLPPGPYRLSFQHVVLDSLGTRSPTVNVMLKAGDRTWVDLALPSGATLLGRLCPPPTADQRSEGWSGLMGIVRDADSDAPMPGAVVRLHWRSVIVDPTLGLRRQVEFRDAASDSSGLYVVCNTPPDLEGTLLAAVPGRDTASAEAFLPKGGAGVMHVHLAKSGATGSLAGTVSDAAGGTLASAEVTVLSRSGAPAPPIARTGQGGTFVLRGVPAGTQVVEAKRVGFQPHRRSVAIAPNGTTRLALTLTAHPVQLADIAVKTQTTAELHGFPDRLKRGGARFYTREDIARTRAVLAVDLVRQFPGMTLEQSSKGPVIVNSSLRQNIRGSTCQISTFLDGVPSAPDLMLNVPAEDLDGVEIYNIPENVPSEYSGPSNGCGAILIWTNWRTRRPTSP